jgi:hypothetical protein
LPDQEKDRTLTSTSIPALPGETEQTEKMKKREKREKSRPISYYLRRDYLESVWTKHWEIIITVILGLIIGVFVLPMFFR